MYICVCVYSHTVVHSYLSSMLDTHILMLSVCNLCIYICIHTYTHIYICIHMHAVQNNG